MASLVPRACVLLAFNFHYILGWHRMIPTNTHTVVRVQTIFAPCAEEMRKKVLAINFHTFFFSRRCCSFFVLHKFVVWSLSFGVRRNCPATNNRWPKVSSTQYMRTIVMAHSSSLVTASLCRASERHREVASRIILCMPFYRFFHTLHATPSPFEC